MRRKKSRRGAAALIVAVCLVVVVAAAAVLLLWDGGRLLGLNRPGGSGAMDSEQAASRSALEAERDALRQQLYEPVLQPDAVVSEAGLVTLDPSYTTGASDLRLDTDAARAFMSLLDDAANEGIDARITLGFAPEQADCAEDAHGGYSADLVSGAAEDEGVPFEQTVCFLFLKDHGVQYGIVCDYQLFLESSADRSPNHFRYVGEEAAAFIYENNLSLSEYRALLEQQLAQVEAELNGTGASAS